MNAISFSLLFIIIGISFTNNDYLRTNATITELTTLEDGYILIYEFQIDGINYKNTEYISALHGNYSRGDKITIQYNKYKPSDCTIAIIKTYSHYIMADAYILILTVFLISVVLKYIKSANKQKVHLLMLFIVLSSCNDKYDNADNVIHKTDKRPFTSYEEAKNTPMPLIREYCLGTTDKVNNEIILKYYTREKTIDNILFNNTLNEINTLYELLKSQYKIQVIFYDGNPLVEIDGKATGTGKEIERHIIDNRK